LKYFALLIIQIVISWRKKSFISKTFPCQENDKKVCSFLGNFVVIFWRGKSQYSPSVLIMMMWMIRKVGSLAALISHDQYILLPEVLELLEAPDHAWS
jgi:hypothetical protein